MGPVAYLACYIFALQICEGFTEFDSLYPSTELIITNQNEYNGLFVKKIGDNLTLSCLLASHDNTNVSTEGEFRWVLPFHDANRTRNIWVEKNVLKLFIETLQPADAGQYICKSLSGLITNAYVVVRPLNPVGVPYCGQNMFSCGDGIRCIATTFLCDGVPDCPYPAKDETPETCGLPDPCIGKLQCSNGRCIPKSWCCKGRWLCVPHPCCAENMQEEFPFEKTGGGLKKKPNDSYLLHATLYKACACIFVVITTATILISAICRARLKRISNRRGHIDIRSSEPLDGHIVDCNATSPGMQDCQYSLVCENEDASSFEILSLANRYPPSYAEITSENRRQGLNQHDSISQSAVRSPSSNIENITTPDLEADGQNLNSIESPITNQSSPVRRPNDFGMGFIANAIFNTWYRPVPQQNNEISSLDYATDSDSSCRSPTIRPPNNTLNPGTLEFNSHFYGERVGGLPEGNALRGWSESRRLRHSNALDRILDRFGLNAPYNVDIDRDPNTWECQSFLFPPNYSEQSPRRNGQFFSSIWSRLKSRFNRNGQDERSERTNSRNNHVVDQFGDITTARNRRRRPDTPDVPESLNDNNPSRLTSFLNDDTQFDVYGGGFAQIQYFRQRGCFLPRDVQIVPPHNFPPPYTQFALDPPPPYVSRENLLTASNNLNTAIIESDPNGNVIAENSTVANPIVENVVMDDALNSSISMLDTILVESVVAFDRRDDNGNIEQCSPSNINTQNVESLINNSFNTSHTCNDCTESARCNKHKVLNKPLIKSLNKLVDNNVNNNSLNIGSVSYVVDEQEPSTSSIHVGETTAIISQANAISHSCSNNNNIVEVLSASDSIGSHINPSSVDDLDSLNMNSVNKLGCESTSSVDMERFNRINGTMNVLDQNNSSSVPGGIPPFCEPFREKPTEECGLVFPPQNLEFIDSDCNLECV